MTTDIKFYSEIANQILHKKTDYFKDKQIIKKIFTTTGDDHQENIRLRLTIIDSYYSTNMNRRYYGIEHISKLIFYYYKDQKLQIINDIPENEQIFIMKPEYGTEGAGVRKCSVKDFMEYIKSINTNYILQEYIQDCFYENTRHFRINTTCVNGVTKVFSVDERKQINNNKIASNHANGGIVTICHDNKCEFLSIVEQRYIKQACNSLVKLHKDDFDVIPLIGWDVCLTCNGPYYFEGNIGAAITEEIYPKYLRFIDDLYNKI